MSEIRLKPCPFCGGEAYYRTPTHLKGTAFDVMMVECKQCGASPYAVEVYENDTWIHREIDLRWKLLVHLTPEQRESVPPANHSMNGGIYHERTTI